eukprot:155463-Rhodomonas_salina.2
MRRPGKRVAGFGASAASAESSKKTPAFRYSLYGARAFSQLISHLQPAECEEATWLWSTSW